MSPDSFDEQQTELRRDALQNNHLIRNVLGHSTTWSTAGQVDLTTKFSQSLGSNDRTCNHCHRPGEGWTVSAEKIREVFDKTAGLDPLFRTNDGTNSPAADVSTVEARRVAYSMLLSRGTIRVGIGIPAGAEFELVAVDDPYGYASATELSLFRRPLPSANLTLIPSVMWDGRVPNVTVRAQLSDQSNDATLGHAAALAPIDQPTRDAIVGFELGLFNAQVELDEGERLDRDGGRGGAQALASQPFVAGRFNLYDGFAASDQDSRRAIYRGQELFNTRPSLSARTCRGCHSAENIGTNVNGIYFDIGRSSHREIDQPLYTLRRITTGETVETTDPGRALITGRWSDMQRFKVPSLRALGARAPYFHNGSAQTLAEVVDSYEALGFDFTDAEQADVVAFLSAL